MSIFRRRCCCGGDCPNCGCKGWPEGHFVDGQYCEGGWDPPCTPDYPPGNGMCCEALCNGAEGTLKIITTQGKEWFFPQSCRYLTLSLRDNGFGNTEYNYYLYVEAVKIVGDMYYYAKIKQSFQQAMPRRDHLECYQMYAHGQWQGDMRIAYDCTMEQKRNADIIETYESCELSGGDWIFSLAESADVGDFEKGTRVPDITVFNESAALEPYLPFKININWEFYPRFIINTLKKGSPCF